MQVVVCHTLTKPTGGNHERNERHENDGREQEAPRAWLFFSNSGVGPKRIILSLVSRIGFRTTILSAVAADTNPTRQRGSQIITSLALRVSMESAIFDRGQYNSFFLRGARRVFGAEA